MSDTGGYIIDILPPAEFLIGDFAALAEDLGDYKEPLSRAVRDVVSPSIRTNFDVGGRPPWPELTQETVAIRSSAGLDAKPLVRTGALMDAASSPDIWTITNEEATVADLPEEVYYGIYQQDGTNFMPARPFMMLQDPDVDAIVNVFDTWAGERFADHGF